MEEIDAIFFFFCTMWKCGEGDDSGSFSNVVPVWAICHLCWEPNTRAQPWGFARVSSALLSPDVARDLAIQETINCSDNQSKGKGKKKEGFEEKVDQGPFDAVPGGMLGEALIVYDRSHKALREIVPYSSINITAVLLLAHCPKN